MLSGEQFSFSIPERVNVGSYFLDCNLELGRGDKVAIYYEDKTYTFFDLWRLTNKIGNVLKELGMEPENRVLLVLEDSPEWLATWLAVMKIGAVSTNAYTFLKPQDYQYLLELIRPKVVVVDGVTLDRVKKAAEGLKRPKSFLVAGGDARDLKAGEFSLPQMIGSADERLEVEPTHRDDIAYWNFSSGTTGHPKAVPHMHRDTVCGYESIDYYLGYRPDDVVLRVPKLFFHYARDSGCFYALRAGAAVVVFKEKATPVLIFDLVKKYKPTVLINVPTMMRAMIQAPMCERADLRCLRYATSSGELLSAQLYDEWMNTFGVEVIDRVGSAETAMAYLSNRPGAAVRGSSGKITPLTQIKLVDGEGVEVPKGQPGVLMIRGGACGRYYVRELEKSHETFPGNQWVKTGDVFVQDENDDFWYMGRADDMVKVSGVWVSPLEIEGVLQQCPTIKECAVLGVKDKDDLTKLKAFVVAKDDLPAVAENIPGEVERFCRERLAPHKVPRAIEIIAELPKTAQGKIDRRSLRERAVS